MLTLAAMDTFPEGRTEPEPVQSSGTDRALSEKEESTQQDRD